MVEVRIDAAKCDGDGTCVDVCPMNCFELKEVGGKKISVVVRPEACIACRACEVQCPTGAIQVVE